MDSRVSRRQWFAAILSSVFACVMGGRTRTKKVASGAITLPNSRPIVGSWTQEFSRCTIHTCPADSKLLSQKTACPPNLMNGVGRTRRDIHARSDT